jgi:hypothetical protein
MNTSSSDGRFLCNDAIHPPTLPLAVRDAAIPASFYTAYDDDSLSSATSTTRGRRRFRRVRSPRTPGDGDFGVNESTQGVRRRNEWISPTGISEVSIRVKDHNAAGSPLVLVHEQAKNKSCDHSDESSISSISTYGEDVTMQATDSTADDASLNQERNAL